MNVDITLNAQTKPTQSIYLSIYLSIKFFLLSLCISIAISSLSIVHYLFLPVHDLSINQSKFINYQSIDLPIDLHSIQDLNSRS